MNIPSAFSRFAAVLALALATAAPFAPAVAAGDAASRGTRATPKSLAGVDLRDMPLAELARLISQVGNVNVIVTSAVADKKVSLYVRDADIDGLVKNLSRVASVWYRYDAPTRTYLLMSADEYQRDVAITRDDVTRVYTLRNYNVVSAANVLRGLYGRRVRLSNPIEEMPPVELNGDNRTGIGSGNGVNGSFGSSRYGGNGGVFGNNGGGVFGSGRFGNNGGSVSQFGSASFGGMLDDGYGRGGQAQETDPRTQFEKISPDRLSGNVQTNADGVTTVDKSELTSDTALGPPIYVTFNRLHNLLLVRSGDETALREIDALVEKFDRPARQVLLEMQIMEVDLDDGFKSIFDIGLGNQHSARGPNGLGAISERGLSGRRVDGSVAQNAFSSGNFGEESDSTLVWQFVNDHIRARLQLMESQNRVNVLGSPMLVASNNQPARLFIGDEQVLVTGASSNVLTGTTGATSSFITPQTERRNVGQTLTILPRINDDRSVSLTIDQDDSSLNRGGSTIPISTSNGGLRDYPIDIVNTASLQLTALAHDGLTVAVGGLIRQSNTHQDAHVPVLGKIPVLGTLFKRKVKGNSRSQLVLLVTPRVLETAEEADRLARDKASEVIDLRDRPASPRRIEDLPVDERGRVLPRQDAGPQPEVPSRAAEPRH